MSKLLPVAIPMEKLQVWTLMEVTVAMTTIDEILRSLSRLICSSMLAIFTQKATATLLNAFGRLRPHNLYQTKAMSGTTVVNY
ncbi:MAG: hypothetical protein KTR27_03560 [Leptolyngbyaceae cyanobacterium MAG.088]|nr:hypothetical protein [Leptolyngbyaceae cyanobacterium MAG.088]